MARTPLTGEMDVADAISRGPNQDMEVVRAKPAGNESTQVDYATMRELLAACAYQEPDDGSACAARAHQDHMILGMHRELQKQTEER